MKALLIGCGNIGAMYDFNSLAIKTHSKALSLLPQMQVSVYDADPLLSKKVSEKYHFSCIKKEENIVLTDYRWVAIASPTDTHLAWLKECFNANVPMVICEKPIAKTVEELKILEEHYRNGKTKVLVNYFRRFHPHYEELSKTISLLNSSPSHILVEYQRGLINNFSHAADLLEFFYGEHIFDQVHISQLVYDEFENDPTISFSACYNKIPLTVVGLANVHFSYFEISIFYTDLKISIRDIGNKIVVSTSPPKERFYLPLADTKDIKEGMLEENMKYVYQNVQRIYNGEKPDNFLTSLNVNRNFLNLIP